MARLRARDVLKSGEYRALTFDRDGEREIDCGELTISELIEGSNLAPLEHQVTRLIIGLGWQGEQPPPVSARRRIIGVVCGLSTHEVYQIERLARLKMRQAARQYEREAPEDWAVTLFRQEAGGW